MPWPRSTPPPHAQGGEQPSPPPTTTLLPPASVADDEARAAGRSRAAAPLILLLLLLLRPVLLVLLAATAVVGRRPAAPGLGGAPWAAWIPLLGSWEVVASCVLCWGLEAWTKEMLRRMAVHWINQFDGCQSKSSQSAIAESRPCQRGIHRGNACSKRDLTGGRYVRNYEQRANGGAPSSERRWRVWWVVPWHTVDEAAGPFPTRRLPGRGWTASAQHAPICSRSLGRAGWPARPRPSACVRGPMMIGAPPSPTLSLYLNTLTSTRSRCGPRCAHRRPNTQAGDRKRRNHVWLAGVIVPASSGRVSGAFEACGS